VGLEGLLLEPNRFTVSRHRLGSAGDSDPTPFRLAVLTDLHLGSVGRFEESVAEGVAALDPHAILIVGDAIDQGHALPILDSFLSLLPVAVPKYATLGNWEHWCGVNLRQLASTYDKHAGRLLVNESVRISHQGRSATLVGVDDLVGGKPDIERAFASDSFGEEVLLLSHCPAYRDVLAGDAARQVSAMISGHTHGGQVAFGPWAPLRPRGSGRYVAGWYQDDGPDLYVSRGVGTSIVPVRFGSVPEVVLIEWFLKSF